MVGFKFEPRANKAASDHCHGSAAAGRVPLAGGTPGPVRTTTRMTGMPSQILILPDLDSESDASATSGHMTRTLASSLSPVADRPTLGLR